MENVNSNDYSKITFALNIKLMYTLNRKHDKQEKVSKQQQKITKITNTVKVNIAYWSFPYAYSTSLLSFYVLEILPRD